MAIETRLAGLDIAKNVLQVIGVDHQGETVLRSEFGGTCGRLPLWIEERVQNGTACRPTDVTGWVMGIFFREVIGSAIELA